MDRHDDGTWLRLYPRGRHGTGKNRAGDCLHPSPQGNEIAHKWRLDMRSGHSHHQLGARTRKVRAISQRFHLLRSWTTPQIGRYPPHLLRNLSPRQGKI